MSDYLCHKSKQLFRARSLVVHFINAVTYFMQRFSRVGIQKAAP